MFKVRRLTEEDYPELCDWWNFWPGWKPIERDMLPENGTCGLMVYKGDINICAGFLYFTNSKIAWQEFNISNFNYKDKDRKEAIQLLINELSNIAEGKGFKVIFTSVKNPNLIKHYEACGFSTGSKGTIEMIKKLQD